MKIGFLSYRVDHFDVELNREGLQVDMDLLEELRKKATVRAGAYYQRGSISQSEGKGHKCKGR